MPPCPLSLFGIVDANDWPLRVSAKFMLRGIVRRFWYDDHPGKAPVFRTYLAAERALVQLHRKHGHEVTSSQASEAMTASYAESLRRRLDFRAALHIETSEDDCGP